MEAKISEQLRQLIQSTNASDYVDVIIELHHDQEDDAVEPQTRDQRIAHLKETFSRKIIPLQEKIQGIGGEVTGQAWINQTLRVRVSADKISLLRDHDEVARLDVPHSLERDIAR